jgi:glycosyltransferase involved in cell wall biosynthesis
MQKDKKILLITDTVCDANGVSRFIQDMAKNANEYKIPFRVLSATAKTYCDSYPNIHILKPLLRFKMPFYKELDIAFPPYFKMAKEFKQFNPDIVHISTPGLVGFWGLCLALWYKKPIVGTYHTDFPMYIYENTKSNFTRKVTGFFMGLFYKKFSALITRSKEYIPNISKDIGFDANKIHVLKPGTDLKKFKSSYHNNNIWLQYDIPTDTKKFLYVGRITCEKNLDLLFEYWKEFYEKSELKNSTLVLIGEGDLEIRKDELKNFNVEFLGHKRGEELYTLYASSDFFVFPSTTDTLGQVVLESLACATPVLVTTIGGPNSIVSAAKDEVGFALNPNDKSAWINKFLEIEKDTIDLDKLSNNTQEHIKNYSIEKSFENFIKINYDCTLCSQP